MKTKNILLVCLSIFIFYSCNTGTKKSKENIIEKPVEKKDTTAVTKKEAPFVYGIDVSSYQGDETELINSKKDSIGFIFCKATEGITYLDPKFEENWIQIKADGFIRGTYHFYRSADDPIEQAKFFAKTIETITDSDLAPVVDFEGGGIDQSQSVEVIQKDLDRFLQALEKQLGRKPIIYTNIPIADKYLNDSKYTSYALWIANYVKKDQPDLPITWKDKGWTFWQRNATYKLDNFTDDSDVFNGDLSKLKSFIVEYK